MVRIKLQLDWLANFQFAGVIYAHYHGWYSKAGIDLKIIPWQAMTNPVDALNDDGFVIAVAEENLIIKAKAGGKPIRAIGTMLQFSPIGWMALEEANIHDLNDLKGKRLGIHGDGKMAVEAAMSYFGLTHQDIEVVEIGYDYGKILASKDCAAVQCLVMAEPLELKEEGYQLNVMPAYQWGYESYCQIMAVKEDLLEKESVILEKFLQITFDGWRESLKDIQAITEIICEHYLPEGKAELEAEMLEAYIPFIVGKTGLDRLGWMEEKRWEQSIQSMFDKKLIPALIPVETIMSNSFIESIYKGAHH